jgi:iron complex outermembrane receptor protein
LGRRARELGRRLGTCRWKLCVKQYFDLENRPTASQGGYGLLNARLGWKTASGNAGVDLWIRNIANTFYTTDKIDLLSGFGFIYNRVGDPRTFGATLAISF